MTARDELGPARWERLEELWRGMDPLRDGGDNALDALPADAAGLRPELESLLSCVTDAEAFFDRFAVTVEDTVSAFTADAPDESDVAAALRAMPLLSPDVADPLVGRMLRQYRIEERIGEGGMGVVYRAYDTRLQRTVALKFLPDRLNADVRAKQRFLNEARAAAALDHPNICTIHEVADLPGSRTFIAMTYYAGETLEHVLEKGALPWRVAVDYATQIARGLAAAHERGIVHRDVKPANVVLTAGGVVKLLDFGIARFPDVAVSRPGVRPGTIAYMSPEQVAAAQVDHRTDVWSVGVVLYQMCTGARPFDRDDPGATLHAILHDHPQAASSRQRDVPAAIDSLLDRLLQKDAAARPGNAQEVAALLASVAAGEGHAMRQPRRPARATVIGGLLVAAITVSWWLAVRDDRSRGASAPLLDGTLPSLAVLPLESFSDAPRDQWFADAMHDQLLAELMTIEAITVIARTSVLPYRDRRTPLPRIADELDVDYLLEGSAVNDGGRVRVNVRLYDRAGTALWSDSFEREFNGLLGLQAEVAATVARSIDARLTPREQQRISTKRTVVPAAFDLYVEGRRYLDQGGPERNVSRDSAVVLIERASQLFEQAIREDSTWARVWADLAAARHWYASTLVNMPVAQRGGAGPRFAAVDSLYRASQEAAEQAIRLDPGEAAGWGALGFVLQRWAWNWPGSERAYREARRLSPNSFDWGAAWLYLALARTDEALEAFEHASRRHPGSRLLHAQYGLVLACLGRHDDARRYLDTPALANLGPGYDDVWGQALLFAGRYAEAVTELEADITSGEDPPSYLSYAYARVGNREKALEVVRIREARGIRDLADDIAIGDHDALVRRLHSMVERRDETIVNLRCKPVYGDVLAVHEARAILEGLNLPTSPVEAARQPPFTKFPPAVRSGTPAAARRP